MLSSDQQKKLKQLLSKNLEFDDYQSIAFIALIHRTVSVEALVELQILLDSPDFKADSSTPETECTFWENLNSIVQPLWFRTKPTHYIIQQLQKSGIDIPVIEERFDIPEVELSDLPDEGPAYATINQIKILLPQTGLYAGKMLGPDTPQHHNIIDILGGAYIRAFARIKYTADLLDAGVTFDRILILTGQRELNPEADIKPLKAFLGEAEFAALDPTPRTETDLMLLLAQRLLGKYMGKVILVDTPPKPDGRRPDTTATFKHSVEIVRSIPKEEFKLQDSKIIAILGISTAKSRIDQLIQARTGLLQGGLTQDEYSIEMVAQREGAELTTVKDLILGLSALAGNIFRLSRYKRLVYEDQLKQSPSLSRGAGAGAGSV